MAVIGLVTRQVAATVLLQHLSGIASALLLWAATRRITGSEWAALFPAAIVLLDPDFIFFEHSIMSESWFVLLISAGLYAAVRSLDQPKPYWGWPLARRRGALARRDRPNRRAADDPRRNRGDAASGAALVRIAGGIRRAPPSGS